MKRVMYIKRTKHNAKKELKKWNKQEQVFGRMLKKPKADNCRTRKRW